MSPDRAQRMWGEGAKDGYYLEGGGGGQQQQQQQRGGGGGCCKRSPTDRHDEWRRSATTRSAATHGRETVVGGLEKCCGEEEEDGREKESAVGSEFPFLVLNLEPAHLSMLMQLATLSPTSMRSSSSSSSSRSRSKAAAVAAAAARVRQRSKAAEGNSAFTKTSKRDNDDDNGEEEEEEREEVDRYTSRLTGGAELMQQQLPRHRQRCSSFGDAIRALLCSVRLSGRIVARVRTSSRPLRRQAGRCLSSSKLSIDTFGVYSRDTESTCDVCVCATTHHITSHPPVASILPVNV
eukprot:GHVU01016278.1.p1 GENE.GHVU01016278.1~~GHVU01016278.1.p1  ORF type:complete len:329 (-),score=77.42 GHVU01016278.1:482-1360(-)